VRRWALLAAVLALLGADWGYPEGSNWPGGASRSSSQSARALTLTATLDVPSHAAPWTPTITASVFGYFGEQVFHYYCFAGDIERVTPSTFGTKVGDATQYILDATCPEYTIPGDYVITVWIERAGVVIGDDVTLHIDAAAGQVRIAAADTDPEACAIPCSDLTVSALGYNGTTSYTWKADLDDSCASATTVCSNACWETTLGTGNFLEDAALPDFSGVGLKQMRLCVLDAAPSSAFVQVPFEATSAAADLACTAVASPASSATNPLNNVALEVDCDGGTSAAGCDLTFDCDIAVAGSAPTSLYTNSFATTGAAGCDDATSSSGTTSCAGGTAQVGTGGATTNAIFFHNQYVSATEQFVDVDDMTVLTDSSNPNQNRLNLRDDATTKYLFQTANPATNTGRLTCPGSSCTTPSSMYTDGVAFDFTIHVQDTTTGRAELLDSAGVQLCQCNGNAAGDVDGFVLNGGQAIISFGAVNVRVPGGGSTDPTPVTANTTWPFNTQTEATENCDGYTATSTTARATVACADSEVLQYDIPVQVTAAPTFSITSLTPDIGTTCTIPDCIMRELTMVYAGTATGTVSGIACTLVNGSDSAVLTTTTDAASPYTLAAEGGWAGFDYDESGTYAIRCEATRQGVTANRTINLQANDPPVEVTDLQAAPIQTDRSTAPGGNPSADTVTILDAADGAVAFTCTEADASGIVTYSALSGTTPLTITRTYTTSTKASGSYRTVLTCTRTGATTDTAVATVDVVVTNPTPGTPSWSAGRNASGQLLLYTGKIGASPTVAARYDRVYGVATNRFFNSQNEPSTISDIHVLRNSRLRPPAVTQSGDQPDVININYGTRRFSKWWLIKQVTLERAFFTFTGPHGDVHQTQTAGTNRFVYEAIVFQNSRLQDSGSGQISWNTGMGDGDGGQFKWWVMHDVYAGTTAEGVAVCEALRAASNCSDVSCTFNCSGKRINLPGNASGTVARWLVNVDGNPHFEGGSAASPTNEPLIMIPPTGQTCSSATSTPYDVVSSQAPNDRHCYNTINAALAAGWEEFPFARLACGGWANPATDAPGCVSGYGYAP
jgi:hypothetical protein